MFTWLSKAIRTPAMVAAIVGIIVTAMNNMFPGIDLSAVETVFYFVVAALLGVDLNQLVKSLTRGD